MSKVQNAKIYMAEALISLMEHENIDSISITSIVDKAGVSRMTYYRYFEDKKELLSFYMEYLFDLYLDTVDKNGEFEFRSYEHILKSLDFFKQYRPFVLCLHNAGMSNIMLDSLNLYISRLPKFNKNDKELVYSMYLYAGALYNTYLQWMLYDIDTPSTVIARAICKWEL